MSRFSRFGKRHGPGIDCVMPARERMDECRAVLPDGVVDLWSQSGLCGYSRGLIWMTDPAELQDVLELWFRPPSDYLCFGRTAFADLFLWDGAAIHYLDCQTGELTHLGPRAFVFFESSLCSSTFLNVVLGRGIHRQAVAKLGVLARDECYAFEPVLALGGSGSIDTVARVKLREHLALLGEIVAQETS